MPVTRAAVDRVAETARERGSTQGRRYERRIEAALRATVGLTDPGRGFSVEDAAAELSRPNLGRRVTGPLASPDWWAFADAVAKLEDAAYLCGVIGVGMGPVPYMEGDAPEAYSDESDDPPPGLGAFWFQDCIPVFAPPKASL